MMGFGKSKARITELESVLAAINKSQAVIEFNMDGTVITANDLFCGCLGYSLEEIRGKHHSLFVDPAYRESPEYRAFWERLRSGTFDAQQYKRIGKGGKEVWIQASYNPVLDVHGKPYKVIKFATDTTAQVKAARALDEAVKETQGVIQGVLAGEQRRIGLEGKAGQLEALARSVNQMVDSVLAAVGETQQVVTAALDGDLTKRIAVEGKTGHFKNLSESTNALIDSVAGVITDLKRTAGEVQGGADEISRGNMNLSQRTEQQASSLEETASSMEEMTSTIRQNADNAAQANQLALAARTAAESGGAVVAQAVTAMQGINSASSKIADIIGVIDEIAFQTNLLALNAAVEAARAGEQGRGFAVVATEVRSLASRSAEAAKEIKVLINDSVSKVADGSKLVERSGQTLTDIVGAVKKVTDIVAEIAAASQEQASGIEQVNKAVTSMDEVTQQNAALVEEAAAAAQGLTEQAGQLNALIAKYRVGGIDSHYAAPAARPAPRPASAPPPKAAGERRGPNRPWSGGAKSAKAAAAPAAAGAPRKAAAAGGEPAEWSEF
jgi:methyl-accepting chemotaxis protein